MTKGGKALRFYAGLCILILFHLKAFLQLGLRHIGIKRYPYLSSLLRFLRAYLTDLSIRIAESNCVYVTAAKWAMYLIFFGFIFLSSFCRYEGPVTGYWDTYLSLPALFMKNHAVQFVSTEGHELYQYTLPGKLPDNLVNHDTYGIISKDQRIGSSITATPFVVFFPAYGFRLFYAMTITGIAVFTFLCMRVLGVGRGIALLIAYVSVGNAYLTSLTHLNPNVIGMWCIAVLLYLFLQPTRPWLLLGLLYGVFGGIRNEGIMFAPAIMYLLFATSTHKIRDFVLFSCGALITIAPILYWNQYAFGAMLIHPSQFAHHEGFRPTFPHSFLWWQFQFNGMFNFPLHTEIVRTPYFAFPTFLTIPLSLIHILGLGLSSCAIIGMWFFFKNDRHRARFTWLWFVPMVLLFLFQENWSDMKTTFILLFMHPLLLWAGIGLSALVKVPKKALWGWLFLCGITIALVVHLMVYVYVPVDERWFVRFPRATHETFAFLGDDLRTKPEDKNELDEQRTKLTNPQLFPALDFSFLVKSNFFMTLKNGLQDSPLKVIDYWKYIYGEQV